MYFAATFAGGEVVAGDSDFESASDAGDNGFAGSGYPGGEITDIVFRCGLREAGDGGE